MTDERETKGVRTILNLGHTVGHAIEAAKQYKYNHGEAVALGMRVAAEISRRLKLLSPQDALTIGEILSLAGLPEKIKGATLPDIMKHMSHDKKFHKGKNRFVLMTGVGGVKVVEGIKESVIRAAIKACQ